MRYPIIYETHVRNHTAEGTFAALERDLPRIRDLGVDILWLMPIHPIGEQGRKGTWGSPYAVKDYRAVSPDLGTEEDFSSLAGKAHSLGMKLIIDVVFNHTALDAVLASEHPEWYYQDSNGNLSRKVAEWTDVYDLDFSAPGLDDYLIESLAKWLRLGADGFRCDVAAMIPLEFWEKADRLLSEIKPVVWLAESVEKSFIREHRRLGSAVLSDPELHRVFQLTYDYDGLDYLIDYHAGTGPLKDYLNHLYVQETMFPADAMKMRFIENHDRIRAVEWVGAGRSLVNWTVFYHFLPGAPLVYMGQEHGLESCPQFFEKDTVPWDKGDEAFSPVFVKSLKLSGQIKNSADYCDIEQLADGIVRISWTGAAGIHDIYCNLADRYGPVEVEGEVLFSVSEGKSMVSNYRDFPIVVFRAPESGKE